MLIAAAGPTWADKLEAWSTFGAAVIALAAAVFTLWLLVHTIGEARAARKQAAKERAEAAVDRELARQDRELAAAERRELAAAQARTVVIGSLACETGAADSGYSISRVRTTISNFSAGPVLDLKVHLGSRNVSVKGLPQLMDETAVVGPHEQRQVDHRPRSQQVWGETRDAAMAGVQIRISFTDAAGLRWTRTMTDQPVQDLDN